MKKAFLTSLLLLVCTWLSAGVVSQREAALAAAQPFGVGTPMTLVATSGGATPAYYVFGAQRPGKGFVIVAGDDRVDAIMGYVEHGEFNADKMPPQMAYWLDCLEEQIQMVRSGKAEAYKAPATHAAIEPLVKTQWAQGAPFCNQLPDNPAQGTQFQHTGCVATAMAQILKYWASEKPTTAIPAYTYYLSANGSSASSSSTAYSGGYTVNVPALPATTFNYAIMEDYYGSSDTSEGAAEAAKLMRYCAQAAEMKYKNSSSSATTASSYFGTYFGYNPNTVDESRASYTVATWDELIYGELQASRPVIISGRKYSDTGHAFVCDGYKDGLYHMNWGWRGSYNGYFKLSEANPYGTGTGGGEGADGYSFEQRVLTRLTPETLAPKEQPVLMTVERLDADQSSYTRTATNQNFTVPVNFTIWNRTGQEHQFDMGMGLYQGDVLVSAFSWYSHSLANRSGYNNRTQNISFGSGVTSGTYVLKAISRSSDVSSDWQPDLGSDVYQLYLTIDGNTVTVTKPVTESLKVNSVTYEGALKAGRQITVKANITNEGVNGVNTLYLFVNGSLSTGAGVYIDNGDTDDVLFHFTPTASGICTLRLCYDNSGTREAWNGTVYISAYRQPQLAVQSLGFADAVSGVVKGNTLRVATTLKNNDTEEFNDVLGVRVYGNSTGTGSYSYVKDVEKVFTIAAGATENLEIAVDDLETEHYYIVVLYYLNQSGSVQNLSGGQSSKIKLETDASGIKTVQMDGTGLKEGAPVFNLRGQRVGVVGDPLPKGLYTVKGRKFVVR